MVVVISDGDTNGDTNVPLEGATYIGLPLTVAALALCVPLEPETIHAAGAEW